jgi:D-beta-D-heptose 7-phosphate kinase/D-beta-D-heptose 1-phosphate adenosyltransferase
LHIPKLIPCENVSQLRESLKGKKVVFTNGCFDVLHKGHRKLLEEAHTFGDVLVVGLNSDDSIKRLKGGDRPINTCPQRISALLNSNYINHLIVFEADTPLQLITELRPDVLVKGGDYRTDEIVGNELVAEVRVVRLEAGLSSSGMIDLTHV